MRIVIADDQATVRQGLELLLGGLKDVDVLATAANGQQALDLVAEHEPDAILLDLHMPVLDGIATTKRLVAEHPKVAIVILTTYADDGSVLEALRAGARSYLTKDADRSDIAGALHAAVRGLSVLDPGVQARLLAATSAPQQPARQQPGADAGAGGSAGAGTATVAGTEQSELPDGLTRREAEILGMIGRGLTNGEIAAQLFLSGHTVKTHINRIFTKTGSRDRMAAAKYAQDHGLR
ncbi:response regulator transcription factor [Actinospica durhamensis]|uniref:Response regulator transcription factor n=1 Tax=Actinospica durhamensis TaxID=1508375 RepID=A0A941IUE3_9ACTN|nr:response regulator transcription factor [Actinospica durhamensis]